MEESLVQPSTSENWQIFVREYLMQPILMKYLIFATRISRYSIKEKLKEHGVNRLVIGACSLFKAVDAGLDSSFIQTVDLRNDIVLVHRDNLQGATEKAKKLLEMAVELARSKESVIPSSTPLSPVALVIGGGLTGLKASLGIARPGLEVHLIEKSAELGGHLKHIYSTLEDGDTRTLLEDLIARVKENKFIHLHLETEVIVSRGYAGNFEVDLRDKNSAVQRLQRWSHCCRHWCRRKRSRRIFIWKE